MKTTGTKYSISLDAESDLIIRGIAHNYNSTSQVFQEIIKEWASDRGITVRIVVEGLEGLDDKPREDSVR